MPLTLRYQRAFFVTSLFLPGEPLVFLTPPLPGAPTCPKLSLPRFLFGLAPLFEPNSCRAVLRTRPSPPVAPPPRKRTPHRGRRRAPLISLRGTTPDNVLFSNRLIFFFGFIRLRWCFRLSVLKTLFSPPVSFSPFFPPFCYLAGDAVSSACPFCGFRICSRDFWKAPCLTRARAIIFFSRHSRPILFFSSRIRGALSCSFGILHISGGLFP